MENILVRSAERRDLKTLTELLRALFSVEKDFRFDEARQMAGLKMLLLSPSARVIVAEAPGHAGGEVVGMCSCQLVVSTAEGALSGLVEDVVVAESWRGRGLGRLLLDALTDWAEWQGATRLQLLADVTNETALAFYDRLGWGTTKLICLRKHCLAQ